MSVNEPVVESDVESNVDPDVESEVESYVESELESFDEESKLSLVAHADADKIDVRHTKISHDFKLFMV